MKIVFVRHGESEYNAEPAEDNQDRGLTERGRKQAKYLGIKLKRQNISEIYTSRLLRARQTGGIISKIIKVPVKENLDELDEYPSRNLRSKMARMLNGRLKRLEKFLKKISGEKNGDKTILIVAHGITNRIIMGYLLQIPLERQLLFFRQHNACVNSVVWNEQFSSWHMDRMNDISHLPKELVIE